MVNTPLPHNLKSEAKKAAKILREFTVPSAKVGPDKLIPSGILLKAKGLAILTVVRAGFLVTARGGSGIVIAKLSDDLIDAEWSAPAAIGMAGLGGGFEIGAEVTDFVIILNSRSAVEAFSKGGNLTLGGNFSIAAGPLGRNVEADVAVRSPAAIYTYSKTKGIFAGISVEGSAIVERKDANRKFYDREIRAYQILNGEVDRPEECQALYDVLQLHRERAQQAVVDMAKKQAAKHSEKMGDKIKDKLSSISIPSFGHKSKGEKGSKTETQRTTTVRREVRHDSGELRGTVMKKTTTNVTHTVTKTGGAKDDVWASTKRQKVLARGVALFTYEAQLQCDLSFKRGDQIEILCRTNKQQDWWEGRLHGNVGIFPANYVRVL